MKINLAGAAVLAALSGATHAQGYFDFTQVPGLGDQPTVQIDLTPAMIQFLVGAANETDPNAAAVLEGIENMRVLVYDELEDADAVLEFVDDSSQQLEGDGWQRAVYVQEDDAKVRIYMKFENDMPVGMTVMVVDETEAVFINVAGVIDPAELGALANAVGVGGVLDSVSRTPPAAPAPPAPPATP